MKSSRILGVLVALLAVAALVLATSPRARVLWYAHSMRSPDAKRAREARAALRAIGRPWIDAVYPDLVAGDVREALGGVDGIVFTGRLVDHDGLALRYRVDHVLATDLARASDWEGTEAVVLASDPPAMIRDTELVAASAMLVNNGFLSNRADVAELRLELHERLDDDMRPAVMEAVQAALTRRRRVRSRR